MRQFTFAKVSKLIWLTLLDYPEGFRRRHTGLGAQTVCPNY